MSLPWHDCDQVPKTYFQRQNIRSDCIRDHSNTCSYLYFSHDHSRILSGNGPSICFRTPAYIRDPRNMSVDQSNPIFPFCLFLLHKLLKKFIKNTF